MRALRRTHGQLVAYPRGALITSDKEPGGIFIVVSGMVRITLNTMRGPALVTGNPQVRREGQRGARGGGAGTRLTARVWGQWGVREGSPHVVWVRETRLVGATRPH